MKRFFLTLTAVAIIGLVDVATVAAKEQELVTYSSEVYCILQKNNVEKRYLKVYLQRLGAKPTDSFCDKVNGLVDLARPARWDFKFGRPYPGSAIKLTAHQIALVKASRED
jgi:hypothetical protein